MLAKIFPLQLQIYKACVWHNKCRTTMVLGHRVLEHHA